MKSLQLIKYAFSAILLMGLQACSSSEIGESKDVSPETIYQQYLISYNAGEENATVYAQFRFAGSDGTTLVLSKPGGLTLDGLTLAVDSSETEGAFYKKMIPVSFGDKHELKFTGIDGRKFENHFLIEDFHLTNLPAIVEKCNELPLQFEPIPTGPGYRVEVSSVDTDSSFSITYNSADSIPTLSIPASQLLRQKGNQLKLLATLYKTLPLQEQTAEGGKIEITFASKPVTIILH